jgi:hypothetical protein
LYDKAARLTCSWEDGIAGVALPVPEKVAAHAVFGLEVADDRLDGGSAARFKLDLGRYPALVAGDEDSELVGTSAAIDGR